MDLAARTRPMRAKIEKEAVMLAEHHIAVRTAVLLLPGLIYATPAASQGGRDSNRPPDTSEPSQLQRAPVGHRQPTAADIPKDAPKDPAAAEQEKRQRELDAKLQICRGC